MMWGMTDRGSPRTHAPRFVPPTTGRIRDSEHRHQPPTSDRSGRRGGRSSGRHKPRILRRTVPYPSRTDVQPTMIAQLTGLVDALEDGRCVIDVAGVGYLVHASSRTLAALPRPPELAKLLVETHVREDAIQLFGFTDTAERDWFRLLTTVQGVGPRVALSILSALSPRDLIGAIAARDQASLTRAPGVGARLAARLLTELKDKVGAMPSSTGATPSVQPSPPGGAAGDALSALINLGYRRPEVQATVARVMERLGDSAALDSIIRDSLKELASRTGV
jgi:holliday junction DNA helicase RuvA